MKTKFPLIIGLVIVAVSSSVAYAAGSAAERVVAIRSFDIGGINFMMTKEAIVTTLTSQGYLHQAGLINSHYVFKKEADGQDGVTTIMVQFRHGHEGRFPQDIQLTYVPILTAGKPIDWSKEAYADAVKNYANVLCQGKSMLPQKDSLIMCGLGPQNTQIKVRPQTTGSDGRNYMFDLTRRGYRYTVKAQVIENPH